MKNNRLKILSVVLIYALFALGSGSSGSNASNVSSNSESSTSTDTSKKQEDTDKLPSIEESIIFDEEGITISAKEVVDETFFGQGIKLLIENNSSSDVIVSSDAMAINGYMVSDMIYEKISAGAKAYTTANCLNSDLENAGISQIKEADIWFNLTDPDTYKYLYKADSPAVIKTSAYEDADSSLDIDGAEVVDQKGVRIFVKYVDENSFWGTSVLIYAENNSGRNISLTADNVSVNGFMINGYFYSDIKDGYKAFDTMTLFSSELKENGIEKIENIKMTFNAYDSDSYNTIFETDYVSVDVE